MSTRRRSVPRWWTEQTGGMPHWLAVATAVLIVGLLAWTLAAMPERVTANSDRSPRPVPTFTTGTTESEEPAAFTMPPSGSSVFVIGDSWSVGYSADPGAGYVDYLRNMSGWNITANAQSGTGYTAVLADTGAPFIDRVGDLPAESPALVVVQGGLNDEWQGSGDVHARAGDLIAALRERYDGVEIALVGPSTATLPVSDTLRSIDSQLRTVARNSTGVVYVSPLSDEWVTESNFANFIDEATGHPSNSGHEEYARRLWEALNALAG